MTKEYTKKVLGRTIYFLDEACTICHRDNDLPAIVYDNGSQFWLQNGLIHRDNDLPAIIYDDGTQVWFQNDKRHRETGPAVIYSDGRKYYYFNDILYSEAEFYVKIGKPHLLTFL